MKKIIPFIIALFICSVFLPQALADSLMIQNPDNGHWYQRFDNHMTWHGAKAHCESMGRYLATVTSPQENQFIYDNLVYPIDHFCWLGGTDETNEGTWQWVTGEAWAYSNWATGEPNNLCGAEDYLVMKWNIVDEGGKWNDQNNNGDCGGVSEIHYPICELVQSLFYPAVNYDAGSEPYSVAIGDLNGDGDMDLAVANENSDNVSVLLGKGDGSFQPAVNYGAGDGPRSVAIGDFNVDNNPDLAVANLLSDNVSVLLGKGDGSFQPAVNYGAGDGPTSVAISDLDLAVANRDSHNVSVLLGNGDGSFQPAVNYDVGEGPLAVDVGDLNGDGDLDLAVANENSHNVSVLLGKGDGSFHPAVNYGADENPNSVAIGEFNGNTNSDLAVANWVSDNVSVLLGKGDGSFQPAVNYGAGDGPTSVVVGDLNGDGNQDLAVANENSDNVSVLLGKGDGGFQPAVNYGAGDGPRSVAIGDLNGDGNQDLAVANENSDNVSILINKIQAVNGMVTFEPDPSTFEFIPDPAGCPSGFVGKFGFDATLSNISEKELSNLNVEVDELTNNNLLLTDNGLIGEGGRFAVPEIDDYDDGILSHEENVDVPFTVCLQDKIPFRFFVNVLGVVEEIPIIPDPISYWKFDEGTGDIAHDSKGTNDGIINGASWSTGVSGYALQFDGSDDWVSLLETFIFHKSTDATLAFWMKRTNDAHRSIFWTRGNDSDTNRFNIYSGQLDFGGYGFGFDYRAPNGSLHRIFETPTSLNEWVHIAVTRLGNKYTLYVDGKFNKKATDTNPDLPDYEGTWFMGRREPGVWYKGFIDEVALFNKALSEAQIWQLYNSF